MATKTKILLLRVILDRVYFLASKRLETHKRLMPLLTQFRKLKIVVEL